MGPTQGQRAPVGEAKQRESSMGKNVVTQFIDDKTGDVLTDEGAVNLTLTIQIKRPDARAGGRGWDLWLGPDTEAELWAALQPFTATADEITVRTPGRPRAGTGEHATITAASTEDVRAWWESLTVGQLRELGSDGKPLPNPPESRKGRVPDSVQVAYVKAHATE